MILSIELAGVALAALLSDNFILVNCMGIGTRVESFRYPLDTFRTGYCLTTVMVLSALVIWPIDRFLLVPFGLQYYRLMVCALLVPGIVGLLKLFVKHCVPELYRRIEGNLSAISTNCAALGSALLITRRSYGLLSALVFTLCGGIGATVALTSFASLQREVDLESCPRCFRGLPIKLITAGLMALSLVGFYGLNLNQ